MVKLGTASASYVSTFGCWEWAYRAALGLARTRKIKYYVFRDSEGHWQVWKLNHRPLQQCSQCGRELRAPACGPTHALLAHEAQKR